MLLKIDYKEFMKVFWEKYKEYWTQEKAMFETFIECYKYFFWEVCEFGEDVRPYLLSEEHIEVIFFEAMFRAGYNEFKRLWLLDELKNKDEHL